MMRGDKGGRTPSRSAGDLPLSEYALIGDGHTAALVARDGAIDWLCPDRFDAPAIFCRLLDAERGGFFRVGPTGAADVTFRYADDTNILQTEWQTAAGFLRVIDFMPMRIAGGGQRSTVLRRIECVSGEVDVEIEFAPTPEYARAPVRFEPDGRNWIAKGGGASARLAVSDEFDASVDASTLRATLSGRFPLRTGDVRWACATFGTDGALPAINLAEAEAVLAETQREWERWVARGYFEGPYAGLLRRSALVLRLLVHTPSGAVVAAPTTSLPEEIGGVRNWDYRYCWLRDAAWIVSAFMGLGYHDEAMAFIAWMKERLLATDVPAIVYTVGGSTPREEAELDQLTGWRNSRPVRIGNAAAAQRQNDVFGEVIDAIYICSEQMPSMQPLEPDLFRVVAKLADAAAERWNEPDRGIWEVRGEARPFFSSRLLCWMALDRALRMALRDGLGTPHERARWTAARNAAGHSLLTEGFHRGVRAFTWVIGDPTLGADSLLVARSRLLPPDDVRITQTLARIREQLSEHGLLRRYMTDDGLPGSEGAFTACSFWEVDALALCGRVDEAEVLFNRIVAHASDLGLMSEQIEPRSGELAGNYPQGFTHLALIRSALTIAEARRLPDRSDINED